MAINYERILKDCFWDLNIKDQDIDDILNQNDLRRKKFLFSKILLNSTRVLIDLKIFKSDELKQMIEEYIVPKFNHDYIFRRKNIAEVYFVNKPLLIEELKWIT